MGHQDPPIYVSYVRCPNCHRVLKPPQPLAIGRAQVRCAGCGLQFRVEAGDAPSPDLPTVRGSPPAPAPLPLEETGAPPPEATPGPSPFRSLGPEQPEVPGYTILGELGRGGMGVVYKARHEKLKRVVALKMVLGPLQGGSSEFLRFHAEAEAVARLHHPGIVQIYEIGEHNGQPYLALEFVGGGTLRNRVKGQPQPVRAAAELVELLARAIHAAHLRGIVHRDLKPANILLHQPDAGAGAPAEQTQAGRLYGQPRITDFGLAKRLDSDVSATQQGEILGTPLYMAPEQARGLSEAVGPAVDLYALGAILYELLTGRPPFEALATLDVLQMVTTQPPVPPRRLRGGLPRNLETICLKCLHKDPRKRYASALALADDLRRFLNGEPVQARPVSVPVRLWSWCLRNPVAASLLLTVTLVLGVGLWHLARLSDDIIHDRAEKDVRQETQMLIQTMSCYSDNVVTPLQNSRGEAAAAVGADNGVPFPVAFTMALSNRFAGDDKISTKVRIYSAYPFRIPGRKPATLDEWEKQALDDLTKHPDKKEVETYDTIYDGVRSLRYATPMIMNDKCVDCHNHHPYSPKHDWKKGDVRGVVEVMRPLDADIAATSGRLRSTYALLGGTAVVLLGVCGGALAIGRLRRHL